MKFRKPEFWDQNSISALSILLLPLSKVYSLINFLRKVFGANKLFRSPIFCVVNLYLGGNGKTPLVKKILRLQNLLVKILVLSKKIIIS